jgi:Na+/pantothenate symporter
MIIIYVFSGGWRSSIWINSIQGILLVMGMFILFSTALWYVGVRNSYEYKN